MRLVTGHHSPKNGITWFRVLGYGMAVNDVRKSRRLFSERNGIRGWTIGNYHITFLRRNL